MASNGVPWRVRPITRKAMLGVHIVTAGAWIGIDVILGVLVFTALWTADAGTVAAAYQVLPMLFWPVLVMALGCLISGVALGLSSRWGLLRYRWVITKLALALTLTVLVVLLLGPSLDEAAAAGQRLAETGALGAELSGLIYPPIVSTTALLLATALAVAKPWGLRRRASVPAPAAGRPSERVR
ncbi:hypothetical protein [Pseudonocardia sp. GCM10023141]|uniref:hypothetical protein n=1 Tax=Pseudonocardia sp. GCM10023141 TaxID=3252653 RepID=UPI00361EEDDE